MKIDIQASDFSLTDSVLTFIKERINYTLNSRFDQIQRITIRLSDVNGSRAGIDKRVNVKILLPRMKEIIVDDVKSDIYAAIFKAMDRASLTVNRRLARLQEKKRKLYVPGKEPYELLMNSRVVY